MLQVSRGVLTFKEMFRWLEVPESLDLVVMPRVPSGQQPCSRAKDTTALPQLDPAMEYAADWQSLAIVPGGLWPQLAL